MRKRGIIWDTMMPWLIAIVVLIIVIIFAYLLKDKLIGMGEFLKNLFR